MCPLVMLFSYSNFEKRNPLNLGMENVQEQLTSKSILTIKFEVFQSDVWVWK